MANWINLLDVIYPIGSIYISTKATSPATLIGGTWTQIKGAVLGFTGSNSFSGAASYGGDKKVILKHLPSGNARFRTVTLNDNNVILSASGIFSKSSVDWEGSHSALSQELYEPYRIEELKIEGGGKTFSPTILPFMGGIEQPNIFYKKGRC